MGFLWHACPATLDPMNARTLLCLVLQAVVSTPIGSVFGQGDLTPPGAPTPTMKSLDQVEARTIVNSTNTPGNGIYAFVISQAGSYYLAGKIAITTNGGILVSAPGVTLNLNGFQISRSSGGGGTGIAVQTAANGCSIVNGSVTGFAYGVHCDTSPLPSPAGGTFKDLSVSGCTLTGIIAGNYWRVDGCKSFNNVPGDSLRAGGLSTGNACVVTNCAISGNGGAIAAYVGSGSTVTDCSVTSNIGGYGLYADNGSTVTNCASMGNLSAVGILVDNGVLTKCSACSNAAGIYSNSSCVVESCNASNNHFGSTPGIGISSFFGSIIRNCEVVGNSGNGIQVIESCVVVGNTVTGNSNTTTSSAGIFVSSGMNNRIIANNVSGSSYGIRVVGNSNLVIQNSVNGNSLGNFQIDAGNYVGSIVTPTASGVITGNGPSLGLGTTDPWANIAY